MRECPIRRQHVLHPLLHAIDPDRKPFALFRRLTYHEEGRVLRLTTKTVEFWDLPRRRSSFWDLPQRMGNPGCRNNRYYAVIFSTIWSECNSLLHIYDLEEYFNYLLIKIQYVLYGTKFAQINGWFVLPEWYMMTWTVAHDKVEADQVVYRR